MENIFAIRTTINWHHGFISKKLKNDECTYYSLCNPMSSRLIHLVFIFIFITNIINSLAFIKSPTILLNRQHVTNMNKYKRRKERNIYSNYIIPLRRQQRKLFPKNANFLNFTKRSSTNYTTINNTEVKANNIIMGNIILDVSDVKYILISTVNDNIKIKLENSSKNSTQLPTNMIFNGLQNMDIIFTTVGLVGKIININ
jgi:hypothetical protein